MIRLVLSTMAALAAPRPLEIDSEPHSAARVHSGEDHLAEFFSNRERYIHQSFTNRRHLPGWWTVLKETRLMKPYAAVVHKQWVNTKSGRTAPGGGAVPCHISDPDFTNWQLQEDGYTVRNRRAGTDCGRYPTLEAAQAQAGFMNGDRVTVTQA